MKSAKTKTYRLLKSTIMASTIACVCSPLNHDFLANPAQAQPTSACFGQPVTSLDFGTPSLIAGTDLQVGARYLYPDIIGDGTVDGIIEVIGFANGASLAVIDEPAINPGNFQPELAAALNVDSGVDFRIEFVTAGTATPVFLDIAINSVDVDGNGDPANNGPGDGDLREYVEYENTLNSFVLNNPTNLSVDASGPSAVDRIRFESTTTQFEPGINPAITTNVVAGLYNNISNFEFRIGALQAGAAAGGANQRVTSLGFSCPNFPAPDPVPDANPGLEVTKTASLVNGTPITDPLTVNIAVGQTITYIYDVRNSGDVTLTNINLNDLHGGSGSSPTPGSEILQTDIAPADDSSDAAANGTWDTLAPNDIVRFTATYTVTQQDVDTLQ